MTWRAGSVEAFSNSLAAEIENAFQSLVLATKGEPLQPSGAQDRKVLFAAIAQGVLQYLGANDTQIAVQLSNLPAGAAASIRIPVPRISVSATGSGGSRTAYVTGPNFRREPSRCAGSPAAPRAARPPCPPPERSR
jgi:hypothetical protein